MADSSSSPSDGTIVRVSPTTEMETAEAVLDAARGAAKTVEVVEVGPTGLDGIAPLAMCTRDGTTSFHTNCSPTTAEDIVGRAEEDSLSTDVAHAVVEHEPGTSSMPVPNDGPLAVGRRTILERCGWTDPTSVDGDEEFVVEDARDDPDEVLTTVASLGLLGRGRGDARMDEPIAEGWRRARDADGTPVVVVNAGETDDRNHTDRLLLEADPVAVLDGAAAVASVVGAEHVVVYCPESARETRQNVQEVLDSFAETDAAEGVTVRTFAGPDQYIAAEPTMALEALEGNDRLEARLRPPTPAEYGLEGRPTVVHTPRTFAQVRQVLRSPEAFDPDDADPGTRLVTVTGDVAASATVELPTGGSLAVVRDIVSMDEAFKMACVGGQFGGVTRSLDHSPSAPALTGAHLGTDGVVELLDRSRCAVATAGTRANFAKEENCGRCVPCREGTKQLTNLLRDVYSGEFKDDMLRELARTMHETSICEFGRSASRPVTTAMSEFESEFHAHAEGRCPSGACDTT